MSPYNNTNLFLIRMFTRLVPRCFYPPLAFCTALLFYLLLPSQRRGTRVNLRIVTGRRRVELLILSAYYKFALNWCDIMLIMRLSGPALQGLITKRTTLAPLEEALAAGTGAILISPHLGNWELGSFCLADLGYAVNVLTFKEPDEKVHEMRERLRSERGIRFIYVDREDTSPWAIIEAVNALRRNEIIAILGDRDGSSHTTLLDFFGRPTAVPAGAAYLALASGAPVIPVFVLLENGRYRSVMEPPVMFRGVHGNHAEAVRSGMQQVVSVFERYIREYPDQWYNFFDFWGVAK